MNRLNRCWLAWLVMPVLLVPVAWVSGTLAADCKQTSVGLVPLPELVPGLYLGQFEGGLYPGGNQPPLLHFQTGVARANQVQPLLPDGTPSTDGNYVLLSIGMSNTTQEFCSAGSGLPCDPWTFMGQAANHALVNHDTLALVNGAAGGQVAASWDSPDDLNYNRILETRLQPLGLSEAQVQAVWVKVADAGPTIALPNANADAYALVQHMGNIARTLKIRYPNVKVVCFSSRIYAGYASTQLNPEPYAYESGFAVKWVIEAQIEQMAGGGTDPLAGDLDYNTIAPWITWGPYLWADGLVSAASGLSWQCSDMQSDGTHPAQTGEEKVGTLLLQFMLNSPFAAPWFRSDGGADADLNDDGAVNALDLALLLGSWGPCPPQSDCPADLDGNGIVNPADLAILLGSWP